MMILGGYLGHVNQIRGRKNTDERLIQLPSIQDPGVKEDSSGSPALPPRNKEGFDVVKKDSPYHDGHLKGHSMAAHHNRIRK